MKREAKLLITKAIDSLLLSVEFFNRPQDKGRVTATLILVDHSFEMLLKACILQKGRNIRDKRANQTYGFDKCVRVSLSDETVKFINEEQALILQGINALRDAAQHHLLDISENQFYIHMQSGLTLFRDILKTVFDIELHDYLPNRVLPISTTAPLDIDILFNSEVNEVVKLLQPGSRKQIEARAKLRPLLLLDSSLKGERLQPSPGHLNKIGRDLVLGKPWQDIFSGVASMSIAATDTGHGLGIHWTKKEGIPIHTVPEGTPGASVVAVKRVDELSFYNLSHHQLAEKVGLTGPKTTALVRYLKLEENREYCKIIRIGKSAFKRYSQKAVEHIKDKLPKVSMNDIWKQYGSTHRKEQNAV